MLWPYKTTERSSTRETLFAMVYGTKAVIPMEMGMPTLHSDVIDRPKINQN